MIIVDYCLFEYLPCFIISFNRVCGNGKYDYRIRLGYVEDLTPEEMFATVVGARCCIGKLHQEWARMGAALQEQNVSRSLYAIPRALLAQHTGLVFARAAQNGEVDPLTDVESRLLMGLPIKSD